MLRAQRSGLRAALTSASRVLACVWFSASPALAADPSAARVIALSADGTTVDPTRGHLAISRDIPKALGADPTDGDDADPVRLVFSGLGGSPEAVRLTTHRTDDTLLDTLSSPKLSTSACPPGSAAGPCWSTLPLRLTLDRLDRDYAAARERSLQAALGGDLRVEIAGQAVAHWRIGGSSSSGFASYERLRAKLRVRVLRATPGGVPAIGADAASARSMARTEVEAAGALWAQCGIDLGGPTGPDIEVVDPPPVALLAVGCEAGLPASGGQIAFDVAGHRIRLTTRAGEGPLAVAERLARAIRVFGLRVDVSPNQRTSAGASGAVDLLVRSAHGAPVAISAVPSLALSSDATLGVCLGEVDLGNGLSHFVESDASAGTLEERALVKAFDDHDPSTIDVFFVPSFDQSGRIGESFIDDDGSAIQNTVIIDRAAVRAGPRSYALAHELGHVLLNMPGHPDDYGVDQSSFLMDADAADASVFGPRRLSRADCERVLRESGPDAKVPLLESWPFAAKSGAASPATSER
jgi:hypothetical protein